MPPDFSCQSNASQKKYDYYLIHFYNDNFEYLDFQNSYFELHTLSNIKEVTSLNINTYEDFTTEIEKIKVHERKKTEKGWKRRMIRSSRLFFKSTCDSDAHDLIQYSFRINPGIYISDQLKSAIEEAGLTGWEFVEANGLSHQIVSISQLKK